MIAKRRQDRGEKDVILEYEFLLELNLARSLQNRCYPPPIIGKVSFAHRVLLLAEVAELSRVSGKSRWKAMWTGSKLGGISSHLCVEIISLTALAAADMLEWTYLTEPVAYLVNPVCRETWNERLNPIRV